MASGEGKFFLWVLAGIVVVIAGLVVYSSRGHTSNASSIDTTYGQKLGSDSAPVEIVEFSDFQCPACAEAAPLLMQAYSSNSSDVRLIYMSFPLSQHANGQSSAMAALAAGKQNKFWEMNAILFANQGSWQDLADPTDIFVGYARQLNLNVNQFRTDLSDNSLKDQITATVNEGNKAGLEYTPTFFVNGTKVVGSQTVAQWQALIDTAKKAAAGR